MAGLADLVGQVVRDARALARAELQLARSKLLERVRRSRTGIILLAAALIVANAAITGLVVGLVMGLATIVGGAGAGVIMLVAGLLIAGLLGWIGVRLFSPPPSTTVETQP